MVRLSNLLSTSRVSLSLIHLDEMRHHLLFCGLYMPLECTTTSCQRLGQTRIHVQSFIKRKLFCCLTCHILHVHSFELKMMKFCKIQNIYINEE
jgi:hypothetical protein